MEFKKTNDNILLNITLNILIASAVSYLINPSISTIRMESLLTECYGISVIALVLCYVCIQLCDSGNTSRYIILLFEKSLTCNLLITDLLLLLLMYPHLFGNHLIALMTLSISFNIVIPSVFGVGFGVILLYDFLLLVNEKIRSFFCSPNKFLKK